jgi:chorismate mutase
MSIEKCRAQIDIVDDELLLLLNKRVNLVVDILIEKRRLRLGRRDRQRENEILSRLSRSNAGPLDAPAVEAIFNRIISESRRLAAKLTAPS